MSKQPVTHACPAGHPFPPLIPIQCGHTGCAHLVACEPCSVGMRPNRDSKPDRLMPERFSIRWTYEGYKVSIPNLEQADVVLAADYDRLRAENETLKEEQIAFVRDLEKSQAENERLRATAEAMRKRTCLCAYRCEPGASLFPSIVEVCDDREQLKQDLAHARLLALPSDEDGAS